jgi:hypothetical protein
MWTSEGTGSRCSRRAGNRKASSFMLPQRQPAVASTLWSDTQCSRHHYSLQIAVCEICAQPTALANSAQHRSSRFPRELQLFAACRRVQSVLLDACKAHGWLLLAPQLPGRAQRLRDRPIDTLQVGSRKPLAGLLAANGS